MKKATITLLILVLVLMSFFGCAPRDKELRHVVLLSLIHI